MKKVMNLKIMMLLAMISFFALNASAQKSDEAQVIFKVEQIGRAHV